ncbi:hypothetical protein NKI20_00090 [Mesorhizobium sp. M0830]|uniref:hypothetical protein n=1 Tax=Mesorhizobium sp. M0830 TaxID=2957008 RepID=UPI003335E9AE
MAMSMQGISTLVPFEAEVERVWMPTSIMGFDNLRPPRKGKSPNGDKIPKKE